MAGALLFLSGAMTTQAGWLVARRDGLWWRPALMAGLALMNCVLL